MSWKQTAQSKRETVLASIPEEWRLAQGDISGRTKQPKVVDFVAKRISTSAREITEQSVGQLLQQLQNGQVTASEVLVCATTSQEYLHTLLLGISPIYEPMFFAL